MSDWNEFEGNPQNPNGANQPNGDAFSGGQQSTDAYSGGAYNGGQQSTDAFSGGAYNGGQQAGNPYGGDAFNGGQTYFDPNAMPNQNGTPSQNQGNGMAIASLVLGILGIVACCCAWWVELVFGILAVVFGVMGKKRNLDNGMATAGMVLGIISIVFAVVGGVIGILFSAIYGTSSEQMLEEIMNGYYY